MIVEFWGRSGHHKRQLSERTALARVSSATETAQLFQRNAPWGNLWRKRFDETGDFVDATATAAGLDRCQHEPFVVKSETRFDRTWPISDSLFIFQQEGSLRWRERESNPYASVNEYRVRWDGERGNRTPDTTSFSRVLSHWATSPRKFIQSYMLLKLIFKKILKERVVKNLTGKIFSTQIY